MLVTSLWYVDIILIFMITLLLIYKYQIRHFNYWKKKGIFYLKPVPFFGNAYTLLTFKKNMGPWFKDIYDSVNEPLFGIFVFDQPFLVLKSPELIKHVLVKDFNYFADRVITAPKHDELSKNMMFIQKGVVWRKVRAKMSPVFSSGKLKGMFDIIQNVGSDMSKYISQNLGQLEAKELCAKYSTDVIAACAFAIKAHSFDNEEADFRKIGKAMFDFSWRNAVSQTLSFIGHPMVDLLGLNFFDTYSQSYLTSAFWETIKKREDTNVTGNDLIDIIMNMRKDKELCREINFEGDHVVAQGVQFFAAGFETSSSTIAFTLYELCLHQEIQSKLRREVVENIKRNNGITYEGILEMKYMDMCIKETLRKYPVLPFLDRKCLADYKIPGTNIVLDKGLSVVIPMLGLHYDEKYFSNPKEYDPERFSEKNYNENGIYYVPFGEGPRSCIGERFGTLSVKLSLAHVLSKFILERTADTPVPIEFEPKSFVLQSKVGLPMRFKEIVPKLI